MREGGTRVLRLLASRSRKCMNTVNWQDTCVIIKVFIRDGRESSYGGLAA